MKHTRLTVSLLAILAVSTFADEPAGVIKADDKAALEAAKDKEVTVEGRVASAVWSKSGAVCTIEFAEAPNFMVAVFKKNKEKMDAGFGGDFTKQFDDATIRVTGKVSAYGGKSPKFKDAMQMIVSQTGQVTVVTPASQPTTQP